MSEIDQKRISELLGSTMKHIGRVPFGPMGAQKATEEFRKMKDESKEEEAKEDTPNGD